MRRALLIKAGLLVSSVSTISLGLALWLLPWKRADGVGFDAGDRFAGVGLIACGVVFAIFALLVRSNSSEPAATDAGPPPTPSA